MEKEITGVMFYYYFVCTRKLWYFANEITMEQFNEDVNIGKILDENTYSRDEKHINIDNVINIDFIRSKDILHEIKKSKSIEIASIWQIKYYLYYLKQRGSGISRARLDYPLLKDTVMVELEEGDEEKIETFLSDIKEIIERQKPIKKEKEKLCNKCAYYEFCFI